MLTMKEQLVDYDIDFGTVTITPTSANTPTVAEVTFSKTFASTPMIFANPQTKYSNTCFASATSSITKGYIYLSRVDTTQTIVHWLAIAKKK